MADHKIGTREEWLAAREELLKREKEHTRLRDEIAQARRDLPWVATSPRARGSAPSSGRPTTSTTPTRRRGADWSS